MTPLATRSLLLGLAFLAVGLPLAMMPKAATPILRALPRHVLAGRILSAVALVWSGWLLYRMPFEFLHPFRGWILPMVPVVIALTWMLIPDLLSCRSIGALAVLLPTPLLAAVRAHPSPWRVAVTIVAYAMAVAGMALLMSPYLLRRAVDLVTATTGLMRKHGAVLAGIGAVLVILALSVY